MNKSPLAGIFIIVLAVALIGLFWYVSTKDRDTFRWIETYEPSDEQPYGAQVFYTLLKKQYPGHTFSKISSSFEQDSLLLKDRKGIYVYLGNELYLNETEQNQLLRWVEQGNTAFISAKKFPEILTRVLFDSSCSGIHYSNTFYFIDTLVKANFYHPELLEKQSIDYHYREGNKHFRYDFGAFDSTQFCAQSSFEPLAYLEPNYVNYIRVRHGKGTFLLHATPILFTNYQLIEPKRAAYAAKALSYITPGDIFWDEYHRIQHSESGDPMLKNAPETPLSFILANRSLRWSLYVLLSLAGVYLLFYTRRRQRIIPVIEPARNSSLEFVHAIGRLYFHQRNHPTLLRHQMRYFFTFIRERYRIQTQELTTENMLLISMRSGVPLEILQQIRDESMRLQPFVELQDQEIIAFYKILSQFYTRAK